MSILDSLNPISLIKKALVSDYVGSALRHALTAFGLLLVSNGYANNGVATGWVDATVKLLTSPEAIAGIVALFTGGAASIANKK